MYKVEFLGILLMNGIKSNNNIWGHIIRGIEIGPQWRNRLARRTYNAEAVSSSLTWGSFVLVCLYSNLHLSLHDSDVQKHLLNNTTLLLINTSFYLMISSNLGCIISKVHNTDCLPFVSLLFMMQLG